MTKRVFISYSHDSGGHEDRVLALAEQLRNDGLDVRLDQWETSPREGWPLWMERQLVRADAVVLVCTPTYRRRFEGDEVAGTGKGATWEGMVARQLLYEAGSLNQKLIPIYFESESADDVPLALRGSTYHRLARHDLIDDPGYEDLYRQLTDQPRHRPVPLGQIRRLPPVERRGFGRSPGKVDVDVRGATIGTVINADSVSLGSISVTMPASTPASMPVVTEAKAPTKIVLFSVNATLAGHHLQLEHEMAAIKAAIRAAQCREQYALEICPAATVETMIRALDEIEPEVVHFCGHGDRHGRIMVNEAGADHHVSPETMAQIFAALTKPPSLVTFATCSSYAAASAVAAHVPYVIGFEGEIYDDMLPAFSRVFYERLASHCELDVPRAFRLAKISTIANGHSDVERARLVGVQITEAPTRGPERAPSR
jgi:hypothetical protein